MKTKILKSNKLLLSYLTLFCVLILNTITPNFVNAQTLQYHLGAKLLPDSTYEKLPKVNWEVLRANANRQAIATQSSGVVMLNNPPIGDQGAQGSCVGWAVGYAATSILAYPKFGNWSAAERSPSYVYNQIKVSDDCESGTYVTSALNLESNQGVCSYTSMPYVEADCATQPNSTQRFDAHLNTLLSWNTLTSNNVSAIKQALDLGYPVVIAFHVYQPFVDMWNNNGIWTTNNTGTYYYGDHATCIIGYDDSKQMFKVQNSWGTSGGDNGYFWVTYSLVQNNCLRETYVLSEINRSVYPTLSGPSSICSSSAQFTVNNVPNGATVSWTCSGSVTFDHQTGNPKTFTANGSGSGTIQTVLVTNFGNIALPAQTVTVGLPSTPGIDGDTYLTCSQYLFTESNHRPVTWSVIGPLQISGTNYGYKCIVKGTRDGVGWIRATATNDCGSVMSEILVEVVCGYSLTFSPNPGDGETVVSITPANELSRDGLSESVQTVSGATVFDETIPWDLEVYTQNQLLKDRKDKQIGRSTTINTSGWPEGLYIVKVVYNGDILTGKLMVKH